MGRIGRAWIGIASSPLRFGLAVGVLLTVVYAASGTYRNWPYKIASDGKYYYQYLLSVWHDGDLDFSDDYRVAKQPWMVNEIDHYRHRDRVNPDTGLPTNMFSCGNAVLWAPFYAAVRGVASLGGAEADDDAVPWSRFYQYGVMYSAVVYTAIAAGLALSLLCRWFDPSPAAAAVLLTLVATNWLYYATVEVSMSHAYDVFTAIALVAAFLRARSLERVGPLVLFGVAGGLHALIRAPNAATSAIFGIALAARLVRVPRGGRAAALARVLVAAALMIAVASPWLVVNRVLNGGVLRWGYGAGFVDLSRPHLLEVLFSGRNGLFSHHPILLLGLAGTVWLALGLPAAAARSRPPPGLVRPLLIALGVQWWINAAAIDWWAGDSFGQRRFVGTYFAFMLGGAFVAQAWSRRWPVGWSRIAPVAGVAACGLGLWLMFIHIHFWPYDQPHDVLDWLFRIGPMWLLG